MNNLIVTDNEKLTMSSREVAKLTGKQHSKVISVISDLKIKGIAESATPTEYKNEQNNQVYIEVLLNKRDSLVLVARLSPEFTAAIVDRWQELESQQKPAFQIPQTLGDALQLAADQAKQLELQAPKVDFVDRFVESTGNKSFREVAKLLKANESTFRTFLVKSKIMYKLSGHWTAYTHHINAGRFYVTGGEANGHAYTTCKFTPKGIKYVAGKWVAQLN